MSKEKNRKNKEKTAKRVHFHRKTKRILLKKNEQIRRALENMSTRNASEISTFENDRVQRNEDSQMEKNELRNWVSQFHISHRAVNHLLKLLNSFGMNHLPMDSRTLLQTPTFIELTGVDNGQFWYNGITCNLYRTLAFLNKDLEISLNINVDGLPLFDKSNIQIWPILVNIHGNNLNYNRRIYNFFKINNFSQNFLKLILFLPRFGVGIRSLQT